MKMNMNMYCYSRSVGRGAGLHSTLERPKRGGIEENFDAVHQGRERTVGALSFISVSTLAWWRMHMCSVNKLCHWERASEKNVSCTCNGLSVSTVVVKEK